MVTPLEDVLAGIRRRGRVLVTAAVRGHRTHRLGERGRDTFVSPIDLRPAPRILGLFGGTGIGQTAFDAGPVRSCRPLSGGSSRRCRE